MDLMASKREDEDVADIDKTELEKRGIVDIPAMLKRRNTNQSVEDMMKTLYKYLEGERYVVQEYKNMEEREMSVSKRQAHMTQLEGSEFNQDNETSTFAQQFGGRGGNPAR